MKYPDNSWGTRDEALDIRRRLDRIERAMIEVVKFLAWCESDTLRVSKSLIRDISEMEKELES